MGDTPPTPTAIVADIDVLAADLFIDGPSRAAMDLIRSHSWMTLVATTDLLDQAAALIESLATPALATDWRKRCVEIATIVEPAGSGQEALVAAHAGNAATVLSLDPAAQSARAGTAIRKAVETSIKSPDAFVTMTDPQSLYQTCFDAPYPGPDRDPRE